jgi:hypothetical protein
MDSFRLSQWTTIRSIAGQTITQSECAWLDLSAYEDAMFHLDVREVTGAVTLAYETSATSQDSSFVSLISFSLATGTRIDQVLFSNCLMPITRFVRWKAYMPSGTADTTFRVWVSAYSYE